jgi:hypothetical protein
VSPEGRQIGLIRLGRPIVVFDVDAVLHYARSLRGVDDEALRDVPVLVGGGDSVLMHRLEMIVDAVRILVPAPRWRNGCLGIGRKEQSGKRRNKSLHYCPPDGVVSGFRA